MAFAPLGKGLLTGKLQDLKSFDTGDLRARLPRFGGSYLRSNQVLVSLLVELADDLAITPAQLALAWLLSRGDEVLPIPGSTSPTHLAENAAAVEVTLPEAVLVRIQGLVEATPVAGPRYPDNWRLPVS
ncbi:hypothetical protein BH10ACT8_BH10ACT8_04080 [soil metagenome]